METLYAALPIVILIVLMGFMKVAGDKSSVVTLLVTACLAIFAFGQPLADTCNSFIYGMLKALVTHSFYHFDGDIQLQCPAAYSENRGVETAIFCHFYRQECPGTPDYLGIWGIAGGHGGLRDGGGDTCSHLD